MVFRSKRKLKTIQPKLLLALFGMLLILFFSGTPYSFAPTQQTMTVSSSSLATVHICSNVYGIIILEFLS